MSAILDAVRRRLSARADPVPPVAPAGPGPPDGGGAWRHAADPRVVRAMPLVGEGGGFARSLATRNQPTILRPLTHSRAMAAPPGVVRAHTVHRLPAPLSTTVRHRPSTPAVTRPVLTEQGGAATDHLPGAGAIEAIAPAVVRAAANADGGPLASGAAVSRSDGPAGPAEGVEGPGVASAAGGGRSARAFSAGAARASSAGLGVAPGSSAMTAGPEPLIAVLRSPGRAEGGGGPIGPSGRVRAGRTATPGPMPAAATVDPSTVGAGPTPSTAAVAGTPGTGLLAPASIPPPTIGRPGVVAVARTVSGVGRRDATTSHGPPVAHHGTAGTARPAPGPSRAALPSTDGPLGEPRGWSTPSRNRPPSDPVAVDRSATDPVVAHDIARVPLPGPPERARPVGPTSGGVAPPTASAARAEAADPPPPRPSTVVDDVGPSDGRHGAPSVHRAADDAPALATNPPAPPSTTAPPGWSPPAGWSTPLGVTQPTVGRRMPVERSRPGDHPAASPPAFSGGELTTATAPSGDRSSPDRSTTATATTAGTPSAPAPAGGVATGDSRLASRSPVTPSASVAAGEVPGNDPGVASAGVVGASTVAAMGAEGPTVARAPVADRRSPEPVIARADPPPAVSSVDRSTPGASHHVDRAAVAPPSPDPTPPSDGIAGAPFPDRPRAATTPRPPVDRATAAPNVGAPAGRVAAVARPVTDGVDRSAADDAGGRSATDPLPPAATPDDWILPSDGTTAAHSSSTVVPSLPTSPPPPDAWSPGTAAGYGRPNRPVVLGRPVSVAATSRSVSRVTAGSPMAVPPAAVAPPTWGWQPGDGHGPSPGPMVVDRAPPAAAPTPAMPTPAMPTPALVGIPAPATAVPTRPRDAAAPPPAVDAAAVEPIAGTLTDAQVSELVERGYHLIVRRLRTDLRLEHERKGRWSDAR